MSIQPAPHASSAAPAAAQQLFRAEAIAARQAQWLGKVRIARPASFALVTAVALCLAAALASFATWGDMTRKARVAGLLMPAAGTLQISAQATGTVLESPVTEGQTVQAGETLFIIATDRTATGSTGTGSTVGASSATDQGLGALVAQNLAARHTALEGEKTLRHLQAGQRTAALQDRLRSQQAELRQLQNEHSLLERRVALAQTSLQRQQQLAAEGFVSAAQSQTKAEELLDLQARLQGVQRNQTALERDGQAIAAEITSTATQTKTDLAQIDRAMAALAQEGLENNARRQLAVLAPQTGVVSALHAKLGQGVAAGQALATIVPGCAAQLPPPAATSPAQHCTAKLEAQLFAPSRTAGFVQIGHTVMLRYGAYPYQKFGMHQGRITHISATPINPQDLPAGSQQALMQAAQSNEPLYRINVALQNQSITTYGQAQPLKPGMALDADVLQDKRAIWEWVLEPVIAARANAQVRL